MDKRYLASFLLLGSFNVSNADNASVLTPSIAIPQISTWDSDQKRAARFWYSGTEYAIDQLDNLLNTVVGAKGNAPNTKVLVGFRLPAIILAACSSLPDALDSILKNTNASVTAETILRYNAAHAAAINSAKCLQLIVDDGRIDINRRTMNGESPLFFAAKHYGESWLLNSTNNDNPLRILLKAKNINLNSEDYLGRTIFHIAVMKGEATVVEVVLSSNFAPVSESGQTLTTACPSCGSVLECDDCHKTAAAIAGADTRYKLDLTKPDAYNYAAIDYIWRITDGAKRLAVMTAIEKAAEKNEQVKNLTFTVSQADCTTIKNQYANVKKIVDTASAEGLSAAENITPLLGEIGTEAENISKNSTLQSVPAEGLSDKWENSPGWEMAKAVANARVKIQENIAKIRDFMSVDAQRITQEQEDAFINLEIALRDIESAIAHL
ncbi:MAG: ankyrin repeat domain-containing protein [Opitutales bacterium]|nr:ankyrin repeat domain-containing protein [Opitutales bacterium]